MGYGTYEAYIASKQHEYGAQFDASNLDMKQELTKVQSACLLRKHTIGDASGFNWSTVNALLTRGYLEMSADRRSILVTGKGKAYCDTHHLEM